MTADSTDCESSLSNNSLSFNCSNRSSLIYCNNACIFLLDRYSFLRTTSYSENITIVVVLSRLWEIEDIGQHEDEKVSYRKTTFLSDKILNNNSPATQILRKSQIVTEDFVEEDLTDFVLETVPNSGDFIRCGSSSSNNDLPSGSSSSNSYSNDLKSKEANAISFVLGEISPLLKTYDNGVTIFRLQEEKQNASDHFRANLIDIQSTLQKEVITKLSESINNQ